MLRSKTLPLDDWEIRNHQPMDYYIQDSTGVWVILWTDEYAERALRKRCPNLKRLKKSFVDFVNKNTATYNRDFTPSPLFTVGMGDPNMHKYEVSFQTWYTNYEDWLLDKAIRQETFDAIYVIEITEVVWNGITARAFIFCIC